MKCRGLLNDTWLKPFLLDLGPWGCDFIRDFSGSGKVEKVLYATVSIVEVHGYESTPSTPFTVTLTSKAPSIVYTALAIAGGIVLILAIIVLVIRWRRRRRYSKTNNRYHTRSGSASVRVRSGSNY